MSSDTLLFHLGSFFDRFGSTLRSFLQLGEYLEVFSALMTLIGIGWN